MNLQAKLTLGAVLLETLIVGAISAVDLGNAMQIELEAAKKHADMVRLWAGADVAQTLNRVPDKPLREALRDSALSQRLKTLMADSDELIEIAVVDPHNEILADSDPARIQQSAAQAQKRLASRWSLGCREILAEYVKDRRVTVKSLIVLLIKRWPRLGAYLE